jgi:hypothetical protein
MSGTSHVQRRRSMNADAGRVMITVSMGPSVVRGFGRGADPGHGKASPVMDWPLPGHQR